MQGTVWTSERVNGNERETTILRFTSMSAGVMQTTFSNPELVEVENEIFTYTFNVGTRSRRTVTLTRTIDGTIVTFVGSVSGRTMRLSVFGEEMVFTKR